MHLNALDWAVFKGKNDGRENFLYERHKSEENLLAKDTFVMYNLSQNITPVTFKTIVPQTSRLCQDVKVTFVKSIYERAVR